MSRLHSKCLWSGTPPGSRTATQAIVGLEALPDLSARMASGAYVPPDIGAPVLQIDNEAEFSPSVPEIIAWVENMTMVRRRPSRNLA